MDQHTVRGLTQLEARYLAHRNLAIGHRHARLDRTPSRRTEHQRQAGFTLGKIRRLGQSIEGALWPQILHCRLNLQVLPRHQGFQVSRLDDAKSRLHDPELRTFPGNTIGHFGDPRLEQHSLQVLGEVNLFDYTYIQALEANGCTYLEAIGSLDTDSDRGPTAIGRLLVLVQAEARNPALERHIRRRRVEGDASGHQALQRLALDLDTGQSTREGDAAGIPESRRAVDQAGVLLLDMYTDQQALALLGELIALNGTHLDLAVENRTADFQRTQVVTEQHQVQPWRLEVQWRRLGARLELALGRGALVAGADSDVVTLDQRFQPGDPGQRDGWLDHPELRAIDQVVFSQGVERQLGHGAGQIRIDLQGFQRPHLNAFVHDRGAPSLEAFEVTQLDLDTNTRLSSIEIFVQTER
ncbi:hypothetical protein D3C77_257710 [compost metagenome]